MRRRGFFSPLLLLQHLAGVIKLSYLGILERGGSEKGRRKVWLGPAGSLSLLARQQRFEKGIVIDDYLTPYRLKVIHDLQRQNW